MSIIIRPYVSRRSTTKVVSVLMSTCCTDKANHRDRVCTGTTVTANRNTGYVYTGVCCVCGSAVRNIFGGDEFVVNNMHEPKNWRELSGIPPMHERKDPYDSQYDECRELALKYAEKHPECELVCKHLREEQ